MEPRAAVRRSSLRNPSPSEVGGQPTLFYRVYRAARPADWVIFVHGAGASAAIWRPQLRQVRRRYNVLLPDLRGHGRSPKATPGIAYTLRSVAEDVLRVMDVERVNAGHFIGMSLGSILVEKIAEVAPDRVRSMVLAGGVAALDAWALLLMRFGQIAKGFLPYMWLYRFFAWIIMPGGIHRRTRRLFHVQARRLTETEFHKWYALAEEVRCATKSFAARQEAIPTMFVMGDGDYMFGRHAAARASRRADTSLAVIGGSGHVCSVERPNEFNAIALRFIGSAAPIAK